MVLSFTQDNTEQKKEHYVVPRRITSRPSQYMEILVSGIMGTSISPTIPWQQLTIKDTKQLAKYGIKDWLEECGSILMDEYNRSNLYYHVQKQIENAVVFGDGAMLIEEDALMRGVRYATVNPTELFYDLNENDQVETVFRAFTMTVENAASFFGLENMSKDVQRFFREQDGKDKPVNLLHAVYRRKDKSGESEINTEMPFASVYVETDSDHIISEGGYSDFPYSVFTWDRTVGKRYGIGPAVKACNDIKLLFKFEEDRARVSQLISQPMYNAPDRLRGRDQVVPGLVNYYKDARDLLSAVQIGGNFPVTIEVVQEQEEKIKERFYVNTFLAMQSRTKQMTAAETIALEGEKAALISTMVNNLDASRRCIVLRTFNILMKQGRLPPPPAALERTEMKVEFTGFLSQAQKKAVETRGIMDGLSLINAVAQIGAVAPQATEALDTVDFEQLLKKGLEGNGITAKAIREDDDVAAIRQMRAQAQAQAQQQALQSQMLIKQAGLPADKQVQLPEQGAA